MKELDHVALMQRALVDRARKDFLAFIVATTDGYEINWHHRYLARKLQLWAEGKIPFLMVFMPPRHGKSEQVSRKLPAYIHGLYPDAEIMAASYLDSLAGDMTIAVQKTMDLPIYQQIFPDTKLWPPQTQYTKGTRNSTEHHIVGRRGKYRGQGVGGSFTGKGANFIIVDDPIKGREAADSEAFREKLWNFWNNDLFSRLETDLRNGRRGQALITQTRWHEDDLSGRLIEKMKSDPKAVQWEIIDFPAIKVDNLNPEDPRQIGEPLWPKKYGIEQLEQIKTSVGQRAWGSLYQQNPVPAGGNLFKDKMFEYVVLPEQFDYSFITADLAYSEKKENDFTCFTAFGVKDREPYIQDVWMEQLQSVDVEDKARAFIKRFQRYGYRRTWIEPKGHGIFLNQKFARESLNIPSEDDLKEFFADRRHDKVERANNVVPHLANRTVKINKHLRNKEDLVAQCLGFPKVKHDDFVDTLIDGLKIIYGRAITILDVL